MSSKKGEVLNIERMILEPEQLLQRGENLTEATLRIYFKIFDEGVGHAMPPVIAIDGEELSVQRMRELERDQSYERLHRHNIDKSVERIEEYYHH